MQGDKRAAASGEPWPPDSPVQVWWSSTTLGS